MNSSSSASLIIRCLGENSDESLVRIYSKMETNYITVNRIISMCDPLVELLFLFNYHVRTFLSYTFCGEARLHGWLTGSDSLTKLSFLQLL